MKNEYKNLNTNRSKYTRPTTNIIRVKIPQILSGSPVIPERIELDYNHATEDSTVMSADCKKNSLWE